MGGGKGDWERKTKKTERKREKKKERISAGKDGMKYLKKRVYPGPVMNGMLVWMGENQAEGADAAIEFLKTQEDVWSKWVSGKAKKAIKASL